MCARREGGKRRFFCFCVSGLDDKAGGAHANSTFAESVDLGEQAGRNGVKLTL